MMVPKCYRVKIEMTDGNVRKFDACFDCVADEKASLYEGDKMEVLGYGNSLPLENQPKYCNICQFEIG